MDGQVEGWMDGMDGYVKDKNGISVANKFNDVNSIRIPYINRALYWSTIVEIRHDDDDDDDVMMTMRRRMMRI